MHWIQIDLHDSAILLVYKLFMHICVKIMTTYDIQNILCTFRTAASLVSIERGSRVITSHTITVLLYSFVADKLIKCVLPS